LALSAIKEVAGVIDVRNSAHCGPVLDNHVETNQIDWGKAVFEGSALGAPYSGGFKSAQAARTA
jgi:hypothetical protein